jgi:hypothetical protein
MEEGTMKTERRKKAVFFHTHEGPTLEWAKATEEEKTLSHAPMKPIKFTAHSLQWLFSFYGPARPLRKPSKERTMRGDWVRRYWLFEGGSIISTPHQLELWLEIPRHSNPKRALKLIHTRAKELIKNFMNYQRILLVPIRSEHPADLHRAHYVIESKKESDGLTPQVGKPGTEKIGLVKDKTPGDRCEFQGPDSAEGAQGLDWLTLRGPAVIRKLELGQKELAASILKLEAQSVANIEAQALITSALAKLIMKEAAKPPEAPNHEQIHS